MGDTDAGPKLLRRQFCGDCGSPLTSEPPNTPDIIVIKAGTLDDWDALTEVEEEIYCFRKYKFLDHIGGDYPKRDKGQ
jgi:hypothetical protein